MAGGVISLGSPITFEPSGTPAFTLTSLAAGAGRLSAQKDQGASAVTREYLLEFKTKFATTPVIGQKLSIFLVRSDGTNVDGGVSTADAALTAAQIERVVKEGQHVGDLVVGIADATKVFTLREIVSVPNRYFSVAVINWTDDALSSTGTDHAASCTPLEQSITATVLAADAIGASEIAAGAIAADAFAAGAIDAAAIANGAIDANTFAAGAIDAAAIADNALDAGAFALSAGEKTTDGVVVTRATAALPQTAAAAIFTVTGAVLLKRIVGYVTTEVGAVANATKLKANSTGAGATTDLCATLDINAHAVDSRYEITGTFANAMVRTLDVPLAKVQVTEIVIPPGTIEVDCAGSDGGTGRVRWSATYVPLESGAQIVAA